MKKLSYILGVAAWLWLVVSAGLTMSCKPSSPPPAATPVPTVGVSPAPTQAITPLPTAPPTKAPTPGPTPIPTPNIDACKAAPLKPFKRNNVLSVAPEDPPGTAPYARHDFYSLALPRLCDGWALFTNIQLEHMRPARNEATVVGWTDPPTDANIKAVMTQYGVTYAHSVACAFEVHPGGAGADSLCLFKTSNIEGFLKRDSYPFALAPWIKRAYSYYRINSAGPPAPAFMEDGGAANEFGPKRVSK